MENRSTSIRLIHRVPRGRRVCSWAVRSRKFSWNENDAFKKDSRLPVFQGSSFRLYVWVWAFLWWYPGPALDWPHFWGIVAANLRGSQGAPDWFELPESQGPHTISAHPCDWDQLSAALPTPHFCDRCHLSPSRWGSDPGPRGDGQMQCESAWNTQLYSQYIYCQYTYSFFHFCFFGLQLHEIEKKCGGRARYLVVELTYTLHICHCFLTFHREEVFFGGVISATFHCHTPGVW